MRLCGGRSEDGGGEGSTYGAGQEQEVIRLPDGVLVPEAVLAACLSLKDKH